MMDLADELMVETTTTETTQGRNQQKSDLDVITMNLASDDLEEESKSHAVKGRDLKELFDSLSEGSPVGQLLVEKSMRNAELKQENDDLRYKLEEANRNHKLIAEDRAALYEMVQGSLQQKLDGGTMDEEHRLAIEHGTIITPSKAPPPQVESIVNELDEYSYKIKCDKFQKEIHGLVSSGRKREVRHNLNLKSMRCTIDQAEKTIDLFSEKCDALIDVIKELEHEKDLQEDMIKFPNANRLARSGRVTETGPDSDEENEKLPGDDDGLRGSAADVCIEPQQAKEEEHQTDSPKTKSRAHTAQSKRRNSKHYDKVAKLNDKVAKLKANQAKQMVRIMSLSRTCVTLTQVIQELEGEKYQQEDNIETLDTQLQEFNADRLGRSSRVTEMGPCSDEENRKLSGDDDGFRCSAADVCLSPQQAKEEKDQADSPDKVADFFYEDTRKKIQGGDDGFRGNSAEFFLGQQQEAKEDEDQTSSLSITSFAEDLIL
jgi:hypothetical protein